MKMPLNSFWKCLLSLIVGAVSFGLAGACDFEFSYLLVGFIAIILVGLIVLLPRVDEE
jgi:hypothetical protein